ncbi:MAG TPA: hypothetical protein VFK54_13000 [Candidatus Limnocylindrales bacterium]|nr:hypothetical protein [Candidatus Limnocylindrales bacterium]
MTGDALTRQTVAEAVARLDPAAIAAERWFGGKGTTVERLALAHAFALPAIPREDVPVDAVLAIVDVHAGARRLDRYLVPFVGSGGALRPAQSGDGVWLALGRAIAEAWTVPALPRRPADGSDDAGSSAAAGAPGPIEAALVCRPSPGFGALVPEGSRAVATLGERALGADQSNTSTVLGERLLLKAYRRLWPGLSPDLEVQAYLSEEAGFPGVPRLAGWAELVARDGEVTTVAMLQEYVADGVDVYETTAERLAAWILAPGEVSVEWATEIAADMGALTAGLHAALADPPGEAVDFLPRDASRDELRAWRRDAHLQLDAGLTAVAAVDRAMADELRDLAPAIAARFTRFEATPTRPLVMRIHGDLHLGQVLAASDGYRVVDFEGEPTRPMDDRRRPGSPLRDVASMLRSLDHVGRSARRRADRRREPGSSHAGLDIEAWLDRARDRFLEAYRAGLREAGSALSVDDDLLEAFEFAKESYELVYAATFLPDWLWAPHEGLRGLVRRFGREPAG